MNSRRGFTLTELNACIAIIGIMAAILLPALARARESARRASCAASLSQIGMSLHMYADENGGQLPWSGGKGDAECLVAFAQQYHATIRPFVCPSDAGISVDDLDPAHWEALKEDSPEEYEPLNARLDSERTLRGSYDYFGAYTRQPIMLPPATEAGFPKVPIMWDVSFHSPLTPMKSRYSYLSHAPGFTNVLWLDGSVTAERAQSFPAMNLPYRPAGIAYDDPESFRPVEEDEF